MTAPPSSRPRPLVLCVVDGLGERDERDGNAARLAKTPNLDALAAAYPRALLAASGPDVGLPAGSAGHGEVGHASLGTGRVPRTIASRIDAAIADGTLRANELVDQTFRVAKNLKSRLHLFGLLSDAGGHASTRHLHWIVEAAQFEDIPIVVHAFLDGRDMPLESASPLLETLDRVLDGKGVIGTLAGSHYALDASGRWDRTNLAYKAIVRGDAPRAETWFEALTGAYQKRIPDALVEPVRIGEYTGMKGDFMADFTSKPLVWEWLGEEAGLAFNVRPDRMRQLSAMFSRKNLPPAALEMLSDRGKPVTAFPEKHYTTLVDHDPALKLPIAFAHDPTPDAFGEVIARAGLRQLRIAETEKIAHVTRFFNGGREEPFEGEDRRVVPSPEDATTWRDQPARSAAAIAAEVEAAVKGGQYDFILVNLANADAVGHTGDLAATIRAVEAVDAAVGVIAAAVREAGGALLVTSDHGNCEQMKDPKGRPSPASTTSPVPVHYVNDRDRGASLRAGGRLADVAPTMLDLLGLRRPEAMTGASLLVRS